VKRQFAVLAVLFFAIAAPAHAGLTVTTSTTQAGAPADVTLDESFATATKHVVIHLPPGLVGNPNAAAKCSQASFNSLGCLPASQVGTATANGLPGRLVLGCCDSAEQSDERDREDQPHEQPRRPGHAGIAAPRAERRRSRAGGRGGEADRQRSVAQHGVHGATSGGR